MSDNDRVLLDDKFVAFKAEHPELLDDAYQFEYFAATNVLKPLFELDATEVFDGLTRDQGEKGTRDGGIDAVYGFVNQTLIREDTAAKAFDNDSVMQFVLIQATRSVGFDEWSMQQFRQSMKDLLYLGLDVRTIRNRYNEAVRNKFASYRNFVRTISPRKLVFHFFNVSRGDNVAPNVAALTGEVGGAVRAHFGDAAVNFTL